MQGNLPSSGTKVECQRFVELRSSVGLQYISDLQEHRNQKRVTRAATARYHLSRNCCLYRTNGRGGFGSQTAAAPPLATPRKTLEKQTVGTVTASHKMLSATLSTHMRHSLRMSPQCATNLVPTPVAAVIWPEPQTSQSSEAQCGDHLPMAISRCPCASDTLIRPWQSLRLMSLSLSLAAIRG